MVLVLKILKIVSETIYFIFYQGMPFIHQQDGLIVLMISFGPV